MSLDENLVNFGGFRTHGTRNHPTKMDDLDLVLKPMVTWGSSILRNHHLSINSWDQTCGMKTIKQTKQLRTQAEKCGVEVSTGKKGNE